MHFSLSTNLLSTYNMPEIMVSACNGEWNFKKTVTKSIGM